jgi:hypothetical protein
MTLQDRRRRSNALRDRLRSASQQLAAALQSMDYQQALTFQLEVDDLRDRLVTEKKAQSAFALGLCLSRRRAR